METEIKCYLIAASKQVDEDIVFSCQDCETLTMNLMNAIRKGAPPEEVEQENDGDYSGRFGGNIDDAYNGGFDDGHTAGRNSYRSQLGL